MKAYLPLLSMVALSRYSLSLLALLTGTLTSAQVEHHVYYRDTMFVKSHEGIYLTFRDSLPDGIWTAYARNSRGFFSRLLHPKVPAFKGNYVAGRKEGTFTYYSTYHRGEVERIENYFQGELDGAFYHFFAHGRVQTCGMYGNGKREGIWMSYDECWGRNTAGEAVSLRGYYLASEMEYSLGEVLWSRRYTCDQISAGLHSPHLRSALSALPALSRDGGRPCGFSAGAMYLGFPRAEVQPYETILRLRGCRVPRRKSCKGVVMRNPDH